MLLTRPVSTCNGVFSVTYFSTKTSNASLSCISRKSREITPTPLEDWVSAIWEGICGEPRDPSESAFSSAESASSCGKWIPDSLADCCDERSLAGLEDAKHPESRGKLCLSKFSLPPNELWQLVGDLAIFSVSSSSSLAVDRVAVKKAHYVIF